MTDHKILKVKGQANHKITGTYTWASDGT